MTLTKENMRTDPTGKIMNTAAIAEDTTHMDESQLERYVKIAFTGESDKEFLPFPFWRYAFRPYAHPGIEGKSPNFPGEFFGGLYTLIPCALKGKFTGPEGRKLEVDPTYKQRLENVLKKILLECLDHKGGITEKEILLAYGTVDALSEIKFSDGPNSPEKQFAAALHKKGGKASMCEAKEISRGLKYPDDNKNELFSLVKKLKKDKRYSMIDYWCF